MTNCAVLELRQYTLHPGARDTLIDIFEREFIESQEEAGMQIIGQFRDLHDPNRFVWLRAFPDMRTRREALASFYGGPAWRANRDAANATMIDSDDVLLLRPLTPSMNFALNGAQR
ncbi:MAG: NIPSNAP family protein, partial [Candidatus Eremiobacteraeota bacterium]|nr:NIPSNAP family protein [Candidatus Eremiobacteraeota bacterium]